MATGIVPATKSRALVMRGKIDALQEALMALPPEEQIPPEDVTTHHFAPGIYARMMLIPKGHAIVGKIHSKTTMNIIAQGKIVVATEQGNVTFTAPCIVNSGPGIKKAGYALEDTIFINIHATDETDLDKLEDEFILKDYEQLEHKPEE